MWLADKASLNIWTHGKYHALKTQRASGSKWVQSTELDIVNRRVTLQFMNVGSWAGVTYLCYVTVLMSSNKNKDVPMVMVLSFFWRTDVRTNIRIHTDVRTYGRRYVRTYGQPRDNQKFWDQWATKFSKVWSSARAHSARWSSASSVLSTIRPKISKFLKRGQMVRKFPGKSSRKSGNC